MSQIYLLKLASEHSKWLTARQEVIASNIANADTPGYKAMDVKPFSEVYSQLGITMAATNRLDIAPTQADFRQEELTQADTGNSDLSGNTVNVDQQLIEAGDVTRSYNLNANISRIFHQMILSTLK